MFAPRRWGWESEIIHAVHGSFRFRIIAVMPSVLGTYLSANSSSQWNVPVFLTSSP